MSKKLFTAFAILSLIITLVPAPSKAVTITNGDLVVASTACKGFSKDAVYYVSGSDLLVFPYLSVYLSWGYPSDFSTTKKVECSDLNGYNVKGYAKFRDGSAFRGTKKTVKGTYEARTVYYVENGKIRPIANCSVYNALFNDTTCKAKTYWVPDEFVDTVNYEEGPMITDGTVLPKGLFVKLPDGRYGIISDSVRVFSSDYAIVANRYDKSKAVPISQTPSESTPITGVESIFTVPGYVAITTPPSETLSVALASDTPAAATVPYGATSVPVLKFNVSGSGTINEVVIKRAGVGSASDFTAAYLYDGYNRLTSGRSISSETNEVTFVNLNLSAPRTLTVKVDLANSSSNANHQSAFSVKSLNGSSVTNVVGNTITISSVQAGSATIAESSSAWSVTLGSSNAEVAKFSISETSGTADLTINAITLRNGGSLSNSYIKNLVLKTGSTILATASEMTGDKAVLVLSTPYTIAKDQTKQFVLYADLKGGRTNDTIKFYLDETSDLNAVDATYGYGVILTNNWASGDQEVTMAGGTITLGFNGPVASNYAKNTTNNDFLKFTLSSERNVTVRKVKMNVYLDAQGDGAYVKNIKIVDLDTGTTLVGPLSTASAGTWSVDHYYKEFSDAFDVTAGTSRHLSVKADIDTGFTTGNTIKISLDLSGTNYVYDNDAGEYVSSSNIVPNTLTGNKMTVQEASLTVSKLATPVSATYIKGSSDVSVLGVGLNAVADTLKVNKITVRLYADDDGSFDNSGYGDYAANNLVSTVSLYEGSTKVAGPVNISLVGTIGSSGGYYKAEFNNLAYQIAKGASKNLTVKVNLLNTFSGSKYLAADIKPSEDMEVEDSQGNLLTISTSNLNLNASPTPVITCAQQGTLTAAVDSSTPNASLAAFGSNGYTVSKFRFTAANEAFVITGAKLLLETSASSRSINKVILTYPKDAAGNTETKEGYLSSGAVTFSDGDLNIYVKKDSYAILTVKVDLNTKEAGATNEDAIRIGLDKDSNDWNNSSDKLTDDFVAVGQSSGEKIYGKTNNITMNNYTLNKVYAMESYPIVALNATSPSGNLVPSANTLVAKFDVTAHANNDVTFENGDSDQLVVNFAVSGASNNTTTVYITDGVNTLCTSSNVNLSTGSTFTCNFSSNSLTVPAGQTKTLYLYVDTVTAGLTTQGDSIQAYLNDDSNNNIKFGIDGSGAYAYGTIILRGKVYGNALVKP